jgi:ketosteroid isomerase-like protein
MGREENAALVTAFFKAFAARDMEQISHLLEPGVTWTTPGRSALGATRQGPAEVVAQLNRSTELTDGTYKADVNDLLSSEEGVVVHYTGSGERHGEAFSFEGLLHFSIRGGRIFSVAFAPLDPQEFDRIWS